MSNPVEKMTIKNLADELGVSKNTVRNQLVNSGFDLAQYKENHERDFRIASNGRKRA